MTRNPHIFDQIIKAGIKAPALESFLTGLHESKRKRVMDQDMFAEEQALGAQYGIFTLAIGWKTADKAAGTPNDESFEAFVQAAMPGELDKAKSEVGDSKVRQGRWLANASPCPQQVSDLYDLLVTALADRGLAD